MLSIVILNYNTYKLTSACIRSVIHQTSINYEIILVDNASTECDPKKFKDLFPSIHLIRNNENGGFAKGNNLGIQQAKGNYILLLNSDTLLINNAIDLAYKRIKQDKTIGALTAQLVNTNGNLESCSYNYTTLPQLWCCTFKLHHIFPALKPVQPNLNKEHFSDSIYGTFFLFPREILELFPQKKLTETFFMYVEDKEWCYYIKKAGYKLIYYPEAKVLHYGGASSCENGARHWKNRLKNEYHLLRKIRGKYFTTVYYIVQSMFYLTSFKREAWGKGRHIAQFTISNLFQYHFESKHVELPGTYGLNSP